MSKSPYCECEGSTECGVCMTERQDRDREQEFAWRNPIRCICPDDAAYHTVACRQQDWSKNEGWKR